MESNVIQLDLKTLLKKILLGWRALIIWMIVGALIVGVYGYSKSGKVINVATGEEVKENVTPQKIEEEKAEKRQTIEELKNILSSREVEEVNAAFATYNRYKKLLDDTDSYINSSIIQNIDAQNASILIARYYIDNHYQVEYPLIDKKDSTVDIIRTYNVKLHDDAVKENVAKRIEHIPSAEYASEMYDVSNEAYSIMTITIFGIDEDDCRTVMKILSHEIGRITSEIQRLYGDFEITNISVSYHQGYNDSIASEQQSKNNERNLLKNNMLTVGNSLSAEEKDYYYALLDGEDYILETLNEGVELGGTIEEEITTTIVYSVDLKFVILGVLVGVFVHSMIMLFIYMFSKKICDSDAVSRRYGIRVIGEVIQENKKRFLGIIDSIIIKLFDTNSSRSNDEKINMICTEMLLLASKNNLNILLLATSDKSNVDICEQIKLRYENLTTLNTNSQNKLDIVTAIDANPEDLIKVANGKAVVLVEKIDKSEWINIDKEVELCNQYATDILGVVTIA